MSKKALCLVDFVDNYFFEHVDQPATIETGVYPLDDKDLKIDFFGRCIAELVPRDICETITNGSKIQIIPYVIIRNGYNIVSYVRGNKSGEQRLVGRVSVGLGGHVDSNIHHVPDLFERAEVFEDHLLEEAGREILEELGIELNLTFNNLNYHLLYTSPTDPKASDVEKAHMGLVIDLDLSSLHIPELESIFEKKMIESAEPGIIDSIKITDMKTLFADHVDNEIELEKWSYMYLNHLRVQDQGIKNEQVENFA